MILADDGEVILMLLLISVTSKGASMIAGLLISVQCYRKILNITAND